MRLKVVESKILILEKLSLELGMARIQLSKCL